MAECPKCHRNSLEYSYGMTSAWCFFIKGCGFKIPVENRQEFNAKFAEDESCHLDQENTCEA